MICIVSFLLLFIILFIVLRLVFKVIPLCVFGCASETDESVYVS